MALKLKIFSNEASGNTVPEVTVEDGVVVEGPLEPVLLVLNRPFPLLNSFAVKVLPSEAGLATELVIDLHRLEFLLTIVRKFICSYHFILGSLSSLNFKFGISGTGIPVNRVPGMVSLFALM